MRLRTPRRIQPVPGMAPWGTLVHSVEGQKGPGQRFQNEILIFSRACLLNTFTLSRLGFSPRNMLRHNGITSDTPQLRGLKNLMYPTLHFTGDVSSNISQRCLQNE